MNRTLQLYFSEMPSAFDISTCNEQAAAQHVELLVREAIAAEREECAKIALGFIPPAEAARKIDFQLCIRDAALSERIAAAIRARGQT